MRSLVLLLGLAAVSAGCLSGVLQAGEPVLYEVRLATALDPGLSRGAHGLPPGAPAWGGDATLFLWTPEDYSAMEDKWPLWDPAMPPTLEPGGRLAFPDEPGARVALDGEGRVNLTVEAEGPVVLTLWVWGQPRDGEAAPGGCEGYHYVSPGGPGFVAHLRDDPTVDLTVPFGAACPEEG